MAHYLVTGVAGFIGSSIAQQLVSQGHRVRGLDNLSSGARANFSAFAGQLDFRMGDICNPDDLLAACEGIDGVFHEAAVASVQESVDHPIRTNEINHVGTLNVLEAAKAKGVRRIVFASSSAIYGEQPATVLHEQLTPAPLSAYGVQKLACEHSLRVACALHGIETVALRYFNVFGPRQSAGSPYSGVIARFIRYLATGAPDAEPAIYGDGQQSRDFVFIADVVAANLRAMTAPADVVAGKAFNVGTGQSQTINNLVEHLRVITGKPLDLKHQPARVGEIVSSTADTTSARNLLGFVPRWSFREGLVRTLNWYCGENLKEQVETEQSSFHIPSAPLLIHAPRPRRQVSFALRQAFGQGDFRLVYQPILDLASHRIVGAETLVRWQRGRELVPASGFIEALKNSGIFEPVERWALQEACNRAAWIHSELTSNFRIAVNIAPKQWEMGKLKAAVGRALRDSGCDPVRLDLEISQRTALPATMDLRETMRHFRELGVTVTLDDFGTEQAHFDCLRQFPISHLKLDKHYCQLDKLDSRELDMVLEAARRAGIACTAEGVETEFQLRHIMLSGCDEAQGFLIAQPMDFDSLVTCIGNDLLIASRHRRQAS